MNTLLRLVVAGLATLSLGACAVVPSTVIVDAYSSYHDAMNRAAGHVRDERWDAALAEVEAAVQALSSGTRSEAEDGNFAYLALRAQAVKAYVKLASGEVAAAKQEYEDLFQRTRTLEVERAEKITKVASRSRIFEGIGGLLSRAVLGDDLEAVLSSETAPELRDIGRGLAPPPVPEGDAGPLSELPPNSDGDRIAVIPTVGVFSRIGRLVTRAGTCTASLVGEALALTSAHCVTEYERRGGQVPQGRWPVRSGRMILAFEGLYAPDRVEVAGVVLNDGNRWRVDEDGSFEGDWAVLRLDRHPVGRGWFGVVDDEPSVRDDIVVAGYAGDVEDGRVLTVDWNCSGATLAESAFTYHACAPAPGRSGSPILVTSGPFRLHYVTGLHSFAAEGAEGRSLGGGPRVSQIREALLAAAGPTA